MDPGMTADDLQPAVLIIDDDASLRDLYSAALRRAGYRVITAPDGQSGLDIVAIEDIGIVLCDLAMPGMNGFEVVRTLRAAPETATLPILMFTGSGGEETVIEGLAAGADDFLTKPIRLDELTARVRAHIRARSAWLGIVQQELRARLDVVATLARLKPSSDPDAVAASIIGELTDRTSAAFVAVFQVTPDQRGRILASTLGTGEALAAAAPTPQRMRYLIDRARNGPWVEEVGAPEPGEPATAFWTAGLALAAASPILSEDHLVGILVMGHRAPTAGPIGPRVRDLALANVIDYAAVLGATIGPSLAAQGETDAHRGRLGIALQRRAFSVVFQPIVELESRATVGYEMLTRFEDGTPPDRRFTEAAAAGLGADYELAAIALGAAQASRLPAGAFVAFNLSPNVMVEEVERLRQILPAGRDVVLEVTEHVAISDYARIREAVASLGDRVVLSVDDAGAGYASLRHILELQPAYAKLDISLVHGIQDDELRQSLAAGLVYYAMRSGFRLVAEGVELETEAAILQALGVDLAQGYLFGKPEPLTS
jgi:EAL domain-containing protein (putative c-di-GMP-specific phosphodiesterase class I)/DNA-binding response OmpR family regulator